MTYTQKSVIELFTVIEILMTVSGKFFIIVFKIRATFIQMLKICLTLVQLNILCVEFAHDL